MRRANSRSRHQSCHNRRLFFEPLEDRRLLTVVQWDTPASNATEANSTLYEPLVRDNSTGSLTVNLEYSGIAVDGTDYTSVSTVSFSNGQNYTQLSVPLLDDAVYDGDKTLKIKILGGTGYTVGSVDDITVLINDNESPATTTTPGNEEIPCSCPCGCSDPTSVGVNVSQASGIVAGDHSFGGLSFNSENLTTPIIGVTTSFSEQAELPEFVKVRPIVNGMPYATIWYDGGDVEGVTTTALPLPPT